MGTLYARTLIFCIYSDYICFHWFFAILNSSQEKIFVS
uniref:Uncharacterized protein n=1 Tax=Rhizophora mucronata TaxID=61149 RepID=A0A2P2Q9Q0_RHIMU